MNLLGSKDIKNRKFRLKNKKIRAIQIIQKYKTF